MPRAYTRDTSPQAGKLRPTLTPRVPAQARRAGQTGRVSRPPSKCSAAAVRPRGTERRSACPALKLLLGSVVVNPSKTARTVGSICEKPFRTRGGNKEGCAFLPSQLRFTQNLVQNPCGLGRIHDRTSDQLNCHESPNRASGQTENSREHLWHFALVPWLWRDPGHPCRPGGSVARR